jgi:hypothetical protein
MNLIEEMSPKALPIKPSSPASITQNCGPTLIPETSQQNVKREIFKSGTEVIYTRGIRRITLERLIISRIVWKKDNVTFDEIIVLYDNLLYLQDLALRDPSFKEKFGSTLEVLAKDLKNLDLNRQDPGMVSQLLYNRFRQSIYDNFIIPQRNLSTVEKHLCNAYTLRATKLPGIPIKMLPPKRWVGIGYRDKGSARNLAKDGSPTWQEVAMSTRFYQKGTYIYEGISD